MEDIENPGDLVNRAWLSGVLQRPLKEQPSFTAQIISVTRGR